MTTQTRKKPGIFGLFLWVLSVFTGLVVMAGFILGFLIVSGVTAPEWVRASIETRLNASIPSGQIHIGKIRLDPFLHGLNPSVTIQAMTLHDPAGQLRARLPEVTGEFSGRALLLGKLRPVSITVAGARVQLVRSRTGTFDLSIGGSEGATPPILGRGANFGSLLGEFEKLFDIPLLSSLKSIRTTGTRVVLDDKMTRRIWVLRDGKLDFTNAPKKLSGTVAFKLDNGAGQPATTTFGWHKKKGAGMSKFSIRFSGLQTSDVASQVAVFNWLKILDAPISGAVTLDVLSNGDFDNMNGVLELGAGRIRQSPKTAPVRFSGAKVYLSYDRKLQKFTFNQIVVKTGAGSLQGEGDAYLGDRIDRTVGALIGQFRFTRMRLDPPGIFKAPVKFDKMLLDMRIRTAPLIIDIGQLVLVDKEARYLLRGRLSAGAKGWTSALDLSIKSLPNSRLMQLWPLIYKPQTRGWLADNVLGGALQNLHGAFRGKPGAPPKITIGFDLKNLLLRFMKTLPPIENGVGYGVLSGNKLHISLEQGTLSAPNGGKINLAGTSFQILNTQIKDAPAQVSLKTQSALPALLSVLDLKPFRFLSKAGLGTDIASGLVTTDGTIGFPLSKKVMFDQVTLAMKGTMQRLRSDKLVRGKVVTAQSLTAFADNSGLTISGSARLGKVAVSGLWRQKFGPKNKGRSMIEGQIELSQAFLTEFGVKLPKGTVSGRGTGHFVVDLRRGKAPTFHIVSDLNRVGLSLAALGWSKPRKVKGSLDIRGSFGRPMKIDRLSIKAPGLVALGTVRLRPGGALDVARFSTFDVGNWMRTPVEIRIAKNGGTAFNITGGELDFRKNRFAKTGEAGKGNQITVKLDRLILSGGISLTDVQGNLNTAGGVSGSFSGRVNNAARIVGTLAPNNGGTAVRFTAKDAGAVLRAAGIFDSAIGGRLDATIVPAGKPGRYDGRLKITKTRVKNANALASLLSAISVVGLLEQLDGEGIAFSDVTAKFSLDSNTVTLKQASAVGASMGLTMEGVYDFKSRKIDMQGVITPVYLLNGILQQSKLFGGLFGKKKGEGLFGFNYTLKGNTSAPKVGVNPLSILTPGVFRELFHRPMPKAVK